MPAIRIHHFSHHAGQPAALAGESEVDLEYDELRWLAAAISHLMQWLFFVHEQKRSLRGASSRINFAKFY